MCAFVFEVNVHRVGTFNLYYYCRSEVFLSLWNFEYVILVDLYYVYIPIFKRMQIKWII